MWYQEAVTVVLAVLAFRISTNGVNRMTTNARFFTILILLNGRYIPFYSQRHMVYGANIVKLPLKLR